MEIQRDFNKVKEALEDFRLHLDRQSRLNYLNAYRTVESKYELDWDKFIKISNFSMRGQLTPSLELVMRRALQWSILTEYEVSLMPKVIIAYAIFCAIGLVGNSIVISHFTIQNFRKMKSYPFLIISLAVIDSLHCLYMALYNSLSYEPDWVMGKFICQNGLFIQTHALPNLTYWLLILISFQRYRTIMRPFNTKIKIKTYAVIVTLMVVFWGVMTYVITYHSGVQPMVYGRDTRGRRICTLPQSGVKITKLDYYLHSLPYGFLQSIPVFIMSYYFVRLWRHLKHEAMASHNNAQTMARIQSRNKKALKVLFLLIVCFVLSAFPSRIYLYFYNYFRIFELGEMMKHDHYKALMATGNAMQLLAMGNSIVNCFVYALFMKDFRKYFVNVITFGLVDRFKRSTTSR